MYIIFAHNSIGASSGDRHCHWRKMQHRFPVPRPRALTFLSLSISHQVLVDGGEGGLASNRESSSGASSRCGRPRTACFGGTVGIGRHGR